MKISVTIITLNEERNIGKAISSVKWADEVIVVDSGSSDRTVEIAQSCDARVFHRDWTGFADQKQYASDIAKNDWIFSLDADEVVSDELKNEISSTIKNGAKADGYRIPRSTFYMGRQIHHSGWYPDYQLRLYDRNKGNWKKIPVHESVEMVASARILKFSSDIYHFSVNDAKHHHRMIGERYAPLAAERMFSEGRTSSAFKILSAGPIAFLRSYLLKLGFLDGVAGIAIANFAAHHAFLKNLLLYEMQRSPSNKERA